MAVNVADVAMCGCGYALLGESEDDLLREAEWHVRIAHPELIGTLSPLELARPQRGEEAA